MAQLPRGISPDLLQSQVRNTMPYLFEGAVVGFPPADTLRAYEPGQPLTHFEYFRLCLSSHYLSCATPVPTDVDNQIRLKLWPKALPVDRKPLNRNGSALKPIPHAAPGRSSRPASTERSRRCRSTRSSAPI